MRSRTALAALLVLAIALPARPGEPASFQVIVHPSNSVSTFTREHLTRLFLKRSTTWEDGAPVVPVDQPESSEVRGQFTRKVLGKSMSAVRSYWQQRIFSGKDVPPLQRASDEEVIAYVRQNPGAVGYVSAGAAPAGVKVIPVQD